MAKLEITLSRAHKIAERLKTKAAEVSAESDRLSSSVHVTGKTGPSQIERLGSQGAKALELSDLSERILRAVAGIRAAIGRENEKRGINATLAIADAVNRSLGNKKSQLERAKDGALGFDEFAHYKPLQEEASYGGGSVRVNVFTDAQRAKIEADLALLQRESFALADKVAEANASRFALELDDDIAAMATGS